MPFYLYFYLLYITLQSNFKGFGSSNIQVIEQDLVWTGGIGLQSLNL